ncbi:MAG TPA: hypothetical protein VIC57_19615 [Candidatus Dormibacteraeota bacterium]|jgi:hypothetical protein
MSQAIASAVTDMHESEAAWRARTAAERSRRHLLRLLDWAIAVCEEVNLGLRDDDDPRRRAVTTLVEQMRVIAGLEQRLGTSAGDLLDQLFELQERYVLAPPGRDDELESVMELAQARGTQELALQAERIALSAGLSLQVLRGPGRTRELVRVRRLIANHLKSRGCSLPAIGELLNRDHSSVVNLLRPASRAAGTPTAAAGEHS